MTNPRICLEKDVRCMGDVDKERLETYRGNHQSVVMDSQESGRWEECCIPIHTTTWRSRFPDPQIEAATPVTRKNVQALQRTVTCEHADRIIFKKTFQAALVEIRSTPEQVPETWLARRLRDS